MLCKMALLEDFGLSFSLETFNELSNKKLLSSQKMQSQDITAHLIPCKQQAHATLISREKGILCGQAWVNKIFSLLGNEESSVQIKWHLKDGDCIQKEQLICELSGNARQLLIGERSALNFLQCFSGTSTLTKRYLHAMGTSRCLLLDTRKTIPGMRYGQKYAVTVGGGHNHRFGLYDAFLIKENHIFSAGSIQKACLIAKEHVPKKQVEIEVENLNELNEAINAQADIVMLDNFTLSDLNRAVQQAKKSLYPIKLEASGNINLDTISAVAQTGVDYISVGGLTKNIHALDLSMRIQC
jgi:nicotinate-nucleotide pyrophosphorylase (carboxylating)